MNGLNLGIIKETKLRKPPIELQMKFASIVAKVESLNTINQQNLNELENLYSTLSQKAFKGELDLSRIPLPAITINGNIIVPPPSIRNEAVTGKAMSHPLARENRLRQFFKSFIANKKGKSFSLEEFWPFIEEKVLEHTDEDSPPLGIADYDQVKQWLFDMLKSGGADQSTNRANVPFAV
jgi:type I restriction enzyme S subunit